MDTFDSPRSSVPARLPGHRVAPPAHRYGPDSNESAPSPISLRVAFRGARRYWWLVLTLWAIGSAGLGAAIYLKVKPSYQATSLLRVSPSETDLYNIRNQGELLEQFLNTQVALITSPNVLTAAGASPKAGALPRIQAAGDVVLELRKVIQVAIRSNTYLIEVSMSSPDRHEAAVLVNAVVAAFIDSNSEWSDSMTRGQIKNLETYLAGLKNESEEKERRWKALVEKGDGGVIAVRPPVGANKANEPGAVGLTTLTAEQYKLIEAQYFQANLELKEKEAVAAKLRRDFENAAKNPAGVEDEGRNQQFLTRRLQADPEIRALYKAVNDAQAKVDDLVAKSRQGNDPATLKARDRWSRAKRDYEATWDDRKAQIREELAAGGDKGLNPEAEVREAEEFVARLKIRSVSLKEELDKVKFEHRRQSTDSVEIQLIQESRNDLIGMQNVVNKRLEQLKFEAKGEARIRAVNEAVAPGKPISDKRVQYLAMAPMGVLAAVLGLVVLLEIRSARVGDPDLLSSRVRHEVFSIAPLPNIRPGEDANDGRAEQRLARFVQSLDHLRVALCEGGVPGEGRCVMITSATGGEGKTTLSAHLAARCANAGTSTLLIDADMRRASLGRLLDVPVGPGLADVLAGDVELDSALVTVQAGGFHFLSAGTPGRDPSRVLKSARLADLIGQLRASYDLVLIDTPPILPVADALIMGRWADGAVMAARFDASRLPLVERANRQLAAAGIPVLGVVVNGVKGHNTTYGDYAYSYLGRPDRAVDAPTS